MHKRLPPENENMKSMIPQFSTFKMQLAFSGEQSLFTSMEQNDDIRDQAGQDGQRMVIRMNAGNDQVYKDYAAGKVTELRELGPKKYLVEDSIRKLAWKLTEDTMTIKGFHCKKAQTKNRQGDNVVAWYTEEIPCPSGPDQFGGLPGLILQVDLGDGWMVSKAVEISTQPSGMVVKAPEGGKKITREEFQKMRDEAFGPSNGGPQIRIVTRTN